MDFDEVIDRRGTHSYKWDGMEAIYGVSPDDGLAMWVADMDFRVPKVVQEAGEKAIRQGIFGYFADYGPYKDAIRWWMAERHGWAVDRGAIFTTYGLVNALGICLNAYTAPGDGIVLFTPVYHAFARTIRAAGRKVVECKLPIQDGRYEPDFDAWDAQMTGNERMMILCSPHNPGGRVWTRAELQGFAAFARRHELLLISDEIHHDIVYPGPSHTPTALIEGIEDRLIVLTAASKTFNLAGLHIGNVIIPDPDLRARFATQMVALGIASNTVGLHMVTAAYSPEGAAWVDALCAYLDENRRVFDAGISTIPGLASMPLDATYLAWVDFTGTGMSTAEFTARVEQNARIATNHGTSFGSGGESFLRFNIATPRSRVIDAVERLQAAFADLQ